MKIPEADGRYADMVDCTHLMEAEVSFSGQELPMLPHAMSEDNNIINFLFNSLSSLRIEAQWLDNNDSLHRSP